MIARPIGDDTLALCPPLVITDDEVDLVLDSLARVLGTWTHDWATMLPCSSNDCR